jgi:type II secretory pathway component PulK
VVTLIVILLITMFLSDFSFSTGLELRMLQTEREQLQSRTLARAAFAALQAALVQDESEFLLGYRQIQDVLKITAIPWEEGRLLRLEVEPLDPLFNLNRFYDLRSNVPQMPALIALFQNVLADVQVQPSDSSPSLEPLAPAQALALYAAIFDWIDSDHVPFTAIAGAYGVEQADYFSDVPMVVVKDKRLDRLTEIRAAKRVAESRIPWRDWETRFTIYQPDAAKNNLYPGLLNVNWATHEQVMAFLKARSFPNPDALDPESRAAQIELNTYADNADAIANALLGESDSQGLAFSARKLSEKDVSARLNEVGGSIKPQYYKQVFSTSDEYFRVRIVIEVGESRTQVDAVLHTPRNKADRTAKSADVLEYTLN